MITSAVQTKTVRCAIYTRKSHEEGLEQEFNSLHAQRESAEAFIASQRQEGWSALPTDYSDGGFSGGTIERPGLQQLLKDIQRGQIDCVMVYKVDRLSRSLLDFARLMAIFDECDVSFVSVTQQFNTTPSAGDCKGQKRQSTKGYARVPLRLRSIATPPNDNNAIVAGSGTSETRNPRLRYSSVG